MIRFRIRFSKTGDLRFIGHRDLMESFFRLLRRASIQPAYSQGFHPKPKVSFPAALPLGVVGENEVLEMEMPDVGEGLEAETIRSRLQKYTIPFLDFLSVERIPEGGKKGKVLSFTYQIFVPLERRRMLAERMDWLSAQTSHLFQRVGREKTVDLKKSLLALRWEAEGRLEFQLRGDLNDGCGPRDILSVLDLADLETCGSVLVRKNVHIG
ncbi:MAG: TIGR03936 family radical SAM-associated protein [Planctomycetia bacterium]|nr:TIGR03936 family radical SAM-associated protein [Planctomycetia bacterium]